MAFDPIDNVNIEVGKPVKKELWQKTKDNFDDLDSRIAALEASGSIFEVFNTPILNIAQYADAGVTGIILWKFVPFDMDLIEGQIYVVKAGSSGTIEMDIQKGADIGSLTSMMSTQPSLAFGDGDNVASTNQVFADSSLSEGEIVAIEFTQIQTGVGAIHVNVLGEPA